LDLIALQHAVPRCSQLSRWVSALFDRHLDFGDVGLVPAADRRGDVRKSLPGRSCGTVSIPLNPARERCIRFGDMIEGAVVYDACRGDRRQLIALQRLVYLRLVFEIHSHFGIHILLPELGIVQQCNTDALASEWVERSVKLAEQVLDGISERSTRDLGLCRSLDNLLTIPPLPVPRLER
jgi:hypothetical protein